MQPCARHSHSLQRQRGAAVVEFALLLTLMITIVAGIVGFGRAMWYYDALSKATRNAARTLSVSNPAAIATAVSDAKTAVVTDATSAGLPSFQTSNVIVACLDSDFAVITCTNGSAPAGVRVSVSSYPVLLGSTIPFLLGASSTYTVNLSPATTMPFMK